MWQGVFFDLDGTLLDTALELVNAANSLRYQRNMDILPVTALKPFVSDGVQGLIGAALSIGPEDKEYEKLRSDFLAYYEQQLCKNTGLFPGVSSLIADLERHGLIWGVVTNKFERYALPLIKHFQLKPCITVCGDTTAYIKPHPGPLLHAMDELQLPPNQCIYIGDDARDIQAGKAAAMKTVGVGYGYGERHALLASQADFWVESVQDIYKILFRDA
jgi:2-phosphoglycolate phosphatase